MDTGDAPDAIFGIRPKPNSVLVYVSFPIFSNYCSAKVYNHMSYSNIITIQINSKKLPNTTRFSMFIHLFYSNSLFTNCKVAKMATAALSNK